MTRHLAAADHEIVQAACERLVPGAADAGVADYVDGLLGAFDVDPPRIWAGPDPRSPVFLPLSAHDELAWRTRIEGSKGLPEREINGPVAGLQERYREGIDALGADFASASADEQDARLRAHADFTALLYEHACEGMYGAPAYGGNRNLVGWESIGFAGDVMPFGYPDEEVSGP